MLAPDISAKAIRDRTPQALTIGGILAALSIGLIAVASAMEETIDDITDSLPEAYSGIIGSGGGNYVISSSFGLLMPIAICVIAISAATRAFASEENRRTADLLLTQPVTRRELVVSKTVVLVGNVVVASVLFGCGAAIGAALVDLDGVTPSLMFAGAVHVCFLGFAIGMIALAAANVSGSAVVGTGTATAVAVISNLAAGLLPLSDSTEWATKLSPWYWFNGSSPTVNGVDVGHLAVLVAIAVVMFGVAVVAVELRDVGSYRTSFTIPAIGRATRPRVATVLVKTLSERTTLLAVGASTLISIAFVCGLMYDALADTLIDFSDELPDALAGLIGTSELGSPGGWIQVEMMATVAPLVMVGLGIVIGVGAIAGEDDEHTLAMLVAGPVTRRSIVIEKALALVIGLVSVGAVAAGALAVASAIGGLDIAIINIVGALAHVSALGIFFGTVGLAIGSATSKTIGLGAAAGSAIAAYLADWLLGISDGTDQFAALSPWFYASDPEAIISGANWGYIGVLATLSFVAVFAATLLFDRREIVA